MESEKTTPCRSAILVRPSIKLALVTALALLIGSGSANAITVKKKRDIPGDPGDVWALVGSFCAIKDWHPMVRDCASTREGDVTYRTVTFRDGSKNRDRLTDTEETSYSYELVESQLPVKNYKATLSVEDDEDSPHRSEVHWEASFDAEGTSEEDAQRRTAEILEAGIRGIKKIAIAADVAKQDSGGDIKN